MNKKVALALLAVAIAALMFVLGHLFAFGACWVLSGLGLDVNVGMPWRVSEMPLGQWYFGSSLGLGAAVVVVLGWASVIHGIQPEPNAWKKPERVSK